MSSITRVGGNTSYLVEEDKPEKLAVRLEVPTRAESARCAHCDAAFQQTVFLFDDKPIIRQSLCGKCAKDRQDEAARRELCAKRAALDRQWAEFCPARYRDSAVDRLPLSRDIVELVLKWRPPRNGQGLGLPGQPRIGKKRLVFLLARDLHFSGIRIAQTSAIEFQRLCADQFDDDLRRVARKRLDHMRSVQVLMFLDIGPERLTERGQVEFYDLIEYRAQNLLPILWTSQFGAKQLAAKFCSSRAAQTDNTAQRGQDAIGRLWQCSEVIPIERESFGAKKEAATPARARSA